MKSFYVFLVCLLFCSISCSSRQKKTFHDDPSVAADSDSIKGKIPFLGAQVFIEPGQTPEEIDTWFRILKQNKFTVCRIRMFESYMRKDDGIWDFSIFDNAFRSAEKYGIRVYATVFPYTEKTDIGGFKFPRDEAHLQSVAYFIKQLVTHFRDYKSLEGWVLINEPGTGGRIPWTEFTRARYNEWEHSSQLKDFTPSGYPVLVDLSEQAFLRDYNTWFLSRIAGEIRKYDTIHDLHVNNHAIFQNCAEYNFPEWRKFLTSLGGSAHAAWHFGYFTRPQYAVAMSANSEIIRSGAGSIPWFMTELQGGNNTYSGGTPMCPTKEEIAQWLWIITATDGIGSIFWCLNSRSSGIEAGEWALLDFQNNPSDRMIAASKVAEAIARNKSVFENCREAESGISILYIRQSLWAESRMATGSPQDFEARRTGGVMKSALGYFEALSEMGVNADLKAIEEFDFGKDDYKGSTIILAHQISVPDSCVLLLENFVRRGGKLIVDGLTAFFDEYMENIMKTGFSFRDLFGGNISEFKLAGNLFNVEMGTCNLPAHLWRGFIKPVCGVTVASFGNEPIAIRTKFGNGEVFWIPSLIGLGSRLSGDYSSLIHFLNQEASASLEKALVRFKNPTKLVIMKTMISESSIVTVTINKSVKKVKAELDFRGVRMTPEIIYSDKNGTIKKNTLIIEPEETMVIKWDHPI